MAAIGRGHRLASGARTFPPATGVTNPLQALRRQFRHQRRRGERHRDPASRRHRWGAVLGVGARGRRRRARRGCVRRIPFSDRPLGMGLRDSVPSHGGTARSLRTSTRLSGCRTSGSIACGSRDSNLFKAPARGTGLHCPTLAPAQGGSSRNSPVRVCADGNPHSCPEWSTGPAPSAGASWTRLGSETMVPSAAPNRPRSPSVHTATVSPNGIGISVVCQRGSTGAASARAAPRGKMSEQVLHKG